MIQFTILSKKISNNFSNLLDMSRFSHLITSVIDNYMVLPWCCHGVAMGWRLGPTLNYAFLCLFQKQWLFDCQQGFRPHIYRSYDHDIFVTFSSHDQLKKFVEYMNRNISISNLLSKISITTFFLSGCQNMSWKKQINHFCV